MGRNDDDTNDDSMEDVLPSRSRRNLRGRYAGEDEGGDLRRTLRERRVYRSIQRRAELGRSRNRGHALPDFVRGKDFRHGLRSAESEHDAKALLYPDDDDDDRDDRDEHDHARRRRSRGSYLPGEQRKRDYRWPVDPVTTVFGVKGVDSTERSESKGVSEALRSIIDDTETRERERPEPRSNVGDPTVKTTSADLLRDRVFGKATSSSNSETAADCLVCDDRGFVATKVGNDDDDDDDDDLGKSARPGFRNAFTQKRRFGCPTVRTDIPRYSRRSVADTQNYGDDVDAGWLLRPRLCSSLGLDDDEFAKPRSREYLESLFRERGRRVDDDDRDDLDAVWRAASAETNQHGDGDGDGDVRTFSSVDRYRDAWNEWASTNKRRSNERALTEGGED